MRVGVFGGSFNPVHLGHLLVAEDAVKMLELDWLLFVPTSIPPHRRDVSVPFDHRLCMVELAVRAFKKTGVSAVERGCPGPSYTVRTLELLKRQFTRSSFYLIVGADQYARIHTWHEPGRITGLACIAVMSRPGIPHPPRFAEHPPDRVRFLDVVPVAIAATTVRERVRAGRSFRYLVPSPVAAYIEEHRLYRDQAQRTSPQGRHVTENKLPGPGPEEVQ
ncbi:MAG: nicotinate-nucleotide adenylyltransferase [candidate division WOR-3 bacterium]